MKKFTSFLNGEKAVKKVLIFLTPFLFALLVFAGIKLGSSINRNEPAPEPVENEITEQATENEPTTKEETYSNPEPEELKADFYGDFVPFVCKGVYYDYTNISSVENQDGTVFKIKKANDGDYCNSIVYILNGKEKTLFSIDKRYVNIRINALIDDALYFNVYGSDTNINGFYRMWLKYNEAKEAYDSGISFRFNKHFSPIKAEDDTLILGFEGIKYISFDTQTGEFFSIDYNKEVEYSELSDELTIDMDTSIDIAAKELKNAKYYVDFYLDDYGTVPGDTHGMSPTGDNTLIYRPDYIYSGYDEFKYDLYPEYAWRITFKGEFWGVVYVNAETGEVTSVSMDFLD